jgi:hypothetical protein
MTLLLIREAFMHRLSKGPFLTLIHRLEFEKGRKSKSKGHSLGPERHVWLLEPCDVLAFDQ